MVPNQEKRTRRRGVIYCKHGCGLKFIPPSSKNVSEAVDFGSPSLPFLEKKGGNAERKARDMFDYHEQQKCPLLPRLVCPLECMYRGNLICFRLFLFVSPCEWCFDMRPTGKVLSFAGKKALRQHFKSKAHIAMVEKKKKLTGKLGAARWFSPLSDLLYL